MFDEACHDRLRRIPPGRFMRVPGRPIVIAAGGTGGHFFPAEALAAELLARGHRIALMTDARSAGLHSRGLRRP